MNPIQLVLDAGGVIVTNLTPAYWEELSLTSEIPVQQLRAQYKHELSVALWTGKVSEPEYHEWLSRMHPRFDDAYLRSLIDKHLRPLPAFARINDWSKHADIHLLSNHRVEWLGPLLAPIRSYLTSITISSEAGCSKPDPAIYERVQGKLKPDRLTLFVDDQAKNFPPAEVLGWKTQLADSDGRWVELINELLKRKEEAT